MLIATSIISPLASTIGINSQFLPEYKSRFGCLLKFNISEAPYPTPVCVKWTEVSSPLKSGCGINSWVFPSIESIPTIPSTLTTIGG